MVEPEDKTQQTTKIWTSTVKLLRRLQGLRMYEGYDDSQAAIIDRLVREELERAEQRMKEAKEKA